MRSSSRRSKIPRATYTDISLCLSSPKAIVTSCIRAHQAFDDDKNIFPLMHKQLCGVEFTLLRTLVEGQFHPCVVAASRSRPLLPSRVDRLADELRGIRARALAELLRPAVADFSDVDVPFLIDAHAMNI